VSYRQPGFVEVQMEHFEKSCTS